MQLDFTPVIERLPYLAGGAWLSLQIAFQAVALGMLIGLVGASLRAYAPGFPRRIVNMYVVFFTNTPQLIQIFFIFFALPDAGILLSPYQAVLIGMTLNAGAYLTEIMRAGFESVRHPELEAAETLGFSRIQTIRYVIVPHVVRVLFPPMSNQYILMTLGTSMAAVFGVEELTGRAYNINSETFRSIEVFSVAAVFYIVITLLATWSLALIGKKFFRAKMRWF